MEDDQQALRRRIGENVRELRRLRGFSQEKLADLLGTDRKNIGRVERGAVNVRIDTLHRIATALAADVSALTAGDSRLRMVRAFTPAEVDLVKGALRVVDRVGRVLRLMPGQSRRALKRKRKSNS